jgi:hypothetical protein
LIAKALNKSGATTRERPVELRQRLRGTSVSAHGSWMAVRDHALDLDGLSALSQDAAIGRVLQLRAGRIGFGCARFWNEESLKAFGLTQKLCRELTFLQGAWSSDLGDAMAGAGGFAY